MSLRDLEFQPVYSSDETPILEEFYIPALAESESYDRIAGYFSSNALAIAARGIAKLINNGGKIRLIVNVFLTESDQKEITEAIREREEKVLQEIHDLEESLKKDHIKMLGWLIRE